MQIIKTQNLGITKKAINQPEINRRVTKLKPLSTANRAVKRGF